MENHICRVCRSIANIQYMVDIEDDYGEKDANGCPLKWLNVFEMCIGQLPFGHKKIDCKICSKCCIQLRNLVKLQHKAQQSDKTLKESINTPKDLPQEPQSDNKKGQLLEEEPKERDSNENLKDTSGCAVTDELQEVSVNEATSSTDSTAEAALESSGIRDDVALECSEYAQQMDFLVFGDFGEDNAPGAAEPLTESKKSKPSLKRQESIRCNLCGKQLQRGSLRRHMYRLHKSKTIQIS